jgi:hypothetical protein
MKRLLIWIIVSFFIFSCAQHPALKIAKSVSEIDDENYIIPYFLNLALLLELPVKSNFKDTRNYIIWVFNNLNYPDKHGLTGTIYDFQITKSGSETPTEKYDSVDSYSASFLMVLNEYVNRTADDKLIRENSAKIKDIAYTLAYLQDSDGLTTALPNSNQKYLMDNCEVYGGLSAFIQLAENHLQFDKEEKMYYSEIQRNLKLGINTILYNPDNRNYDWAVDEVNHQSDWEVYYPDSYAQLFPVLFDITEDDDLKQHLWTEFNKLYKNKTLPKEQAIVYSLTEKRMEL